MAGQRKAPSIIVNEVVEEAAALLPKNRRQLKRKRLEVSPLAAESSKIIEDPIEIKGDEITITQGDRRYRIRGLAKNLSQDILKVNLLAIRGDAIHVDTLDLNVDRQKSVFCKRAAEELEVEEDVIRKDLGRVFLQLEALRNEQIQRALNSKEDEVELSPEEKSAALELLKDPNLLKGY